MAIQQELADDNPGVIDFRSVLSSTHHNLGWLLSNTGESSEAAAEYRKALAILQKLTDDYPAVTDLHSRLALSHNNLAFLLSHMGESSEATAEYRKAQGDPPEAGRRQSHPHRLPPPPGTQLQRLRPAVASDGQGGGGEAEFRKALALYQELVNANPAVPEFRSFLAYSHFNLGYLLWDTGESSEAAAEYGRALVLRQKLTDDYPAIPRFQGELADSLLNLGSQLAQAGKMDEAIGASREKRRSDRSSPRPARQLPMPGMPWRTARP